MYVIVAYDINNKRVNKVKAYLRTKLDWVQNSLFEGEITESKYFLILAELKKIIDEREDSIIIYKFGDKRFFERQTLGVKKAIPEETII
ncbi:MAG: CRISPR-associated endonuclease Cas2 [Candidatus Anstonellaceae archaeon]